MADWNADAYHRISVPQQAWGRRVLERLTWRGDETVLDAGCGTGQLTALLLQQVPRGRVIAIDRSLSMTRVARQHLSAAFGDRALVVHADLLALPLASVVDVIFSTATFHWVLDHDRLFREAFAALRPGGRLVAQCGGGPNLARIYAHTEAVMRQARFAPYFLDWCDPWLFEDADSAAARLRAAGFAEVNTNVEEAPAPFDSVPAFREFITNVIFRHHLETLPGPAERSRFLDEIVERALTDQPSLTLDYWRLNLTARKPAGAPRQ